MHSATAAGGWLRRELSRRRPEANPHRAGLQPAALPVSYRSLTKPTGLEPKAAGGQPAISRETVGRAGRCATASKTSTLGNQRWHGERMTPPPGSRVISCENAIRPPAIANGPRLLRHTGIHRLSKSRGAIPKRRSPHPASCAQVGRSRIPFGRRTWTLDLTAPGRSLPPARCCPARTTNSARLRRVEPIRWVDRWFRCPSHRPRASARASDGIGTPRHRTSVPRPGTLRPAQPPQRLSGRPPGFGR
jgi:hypothetical protein